jgi:hypothetical protein
MVAMKEFTVHAEFDVEAGVWWASNDQLPLSTEAETIDLLMKRVMAIAPDIARSNGLAQPGEELRIHFTADQVGAVAR